MSNAPDIQLTTMCAAFAGCAAHIQAYEDTLTVDRAVKLMRGAKSANRFFYLAVGLHKPHM